MNFSFLWHFIRVEFNFQEVTELMAILHIFCKIQLQLVISSFITNILKFFFGFIFIFNISCGVLTCLQCSQTLQVHIVCTHICFLCSVWDVCRLPNITCRYSPEWGEYTKRVQLLQMLQIFPRTDGKYLRCLHEFCMFAMLVFTCNYWSLREFREFTWIYAAEYLA